MSDRPKNTPSAPSPGPGWVALRGPSGTLYGFLDPARRIVEFKRNDRAREQVDLAPHLDSVKKSG